MNAEIRAKTRIHKSAAIATSARAERQFIRVCRNEQSSFNSDRVGGIDDRITLVGQLVDFSL
jgi:prenyltransferase beta subunit